MPRRTAALAAALLALPVALLPGVGALPGSPTAAAAGPCTGAAPRPVAHVVVVVMENKDRDEVLGSPAAPYLNQLARGCGAATSYHGVAHPSLPNYIALTAGDTFGITDDKLPAAHPLAKPSIFQQLGTGWRAYEQSMPTACQKTGTTLYAPRHNPATYFTPIATTCRQRDVALPSKPVFDAALTFVTPNLVDDMHDGTVAQGDTWLSGFVPKVLASSQYQAGSLALFVVWDENDGPNHAAGNLVPCIVVAPSVRPGTRSGTWFNHYSMLATWEDLLGVGRLAKAAGASSMASAFRLVP
jgi:phosphatidylinositol-3-phosphatase